MPIHCRLPSYENIARRILKTCVESLRKIAKSKECKKEFKEWLEDKIVKKVD